ncbi:mas-related G-protein coupled receptor member H-like [Apus apus]|uniref:mas-related G-protein coupled receptor member H-like n=1 Tax=Apus apus TaxID=8895 RepID=UPI0021F86402|nr:mas-related G-protein coupled receptor member H-like [Apus apus]
MEVKQTPPPSLSPSLTTDEDDLCTIEVPAMAMDCVTLLIGLCGLVGNGAVLWLLGFRIRRNPVTVYILNLAISDFTFLLFMLTSSLLYMLENFYCSTAFLKYLQPLFLLSLFSYNMGLYLLTAISIERCASVLCPSNSRPQWLSAVVCALLWALSIAVVAAVSSLCLAHHHEHCQVALISMYALDFLIFAPPMVISKVILFFNVLCVSQEPQPKRLYIVISLTVLFFLLFALPLSIWSFLQQFGYYFMSSQVVFLLACINSSINPFIYFLVGSCQRCCSWVSLQVAFQRVFEEAAESTACSNGTTMDMLSPAC